MAEGVIDEVVSSEAGKQVQDLIAGLKNIRNEINAINKAPVTMPSQAKGNASASNTTSANVSKQLNEQQRLINRIADARKAEAIETAKLRLQLQNLTAENKKQAQSALGVLGAYQKLSAELNEVRADAKNLAADMFLLEQAGEQNSTQYKELANTYDLVSKRVTVLDDGLKKIDAKAGQYGRNVGNYASGFNPLSNAIGQFAREAPNAAQSFQIFAMSIGNNIGQLQDAITGLTAVNKQLVAQGQPVKSVFSQVLSSIFSLQTALYVGIAVFIAYSKEIGEWTSKLFSGSKALDAMEESQKQLGDIAKESAKSIVQERIELQNNLAIARDTTRSLKEREIAAQNVLDQYPYWFESLGKEAILNGNVEKAVRGVNDALLARAKANAAVGKITENQARVIDLEEERLTVVQELRKAEEALRTIQRRSFAASNAENQAQSEAEALGRVQEAKLEISRIDKERAALDAINQRLTSYSMEQAKEAIGLDYQRAEAAKELAEAEVLGETNSRDAFERNIKLLEDKLSLMNKENKAYGILNAQLEIVKAAYEQLYGEQAKSNEETEKTIKYGTADYYNDVISKLKEEQAAVADSSEQYMVYNDAIETVQEQLDKLTGKQGDVKDLHKEVDDFLRSVRASSLSDLGFDSLNFFADGTFDRLMENADNAKERFAIAFKGISDIAKDTFEFLNQNQQAYFDAQAQNLARERDIALQFAGESEAGRAEIERQYEEKRRELRIKEAKAQKEQAIFNAVINTAQGVTAALAQANIPLSIIIGLLGAAQIALISAREIPAFKDGVDNFGGGLAVVGDGGRSEIIRTLSGELFRTPATDTLVNLPKGSDVFKSEADYLSRSMGKVPEVAVKSLSKRDMIEVMNGTLGRMPVSNTTWDARGVKSWIGTTHARTSHMNNVVRIKGIRT